MSKYNDKFIDWIYPNLFEEEKEKVFIIYNKYIFYLNNDKYEV